MHFYAFYYINYQLALKSLVDHSVSAGITYLKVKPALLPDVLKRHRVAYSRDRLLCVCYSRFDYDLDNLSRIFGPDISFEKYEFGPAEEAELMSWFNAHIQFSKKIPGGVKLRPVEDPVLVGVRRQRQSEDELKKEFLEGMQEHYSQDINPLYDILLRSYGIRVGTTLSQIQDEWLLENRKKMQLWSRLQYEEVHLSSKGRSKKYQIESEVKEFFDEYYDYASELIEKQSNRLGKEFDEKIKVYCREKEIPREFIVNPYGGRDLFNFLEFQYPKISPGYAVVRPTLASSRDPRELFYARVEPYERHIAHINYMFPAPLPVVVSPRKKQRK